jgi:hypothetical protein
LCQVVQVELVELVAHQAHDNNLSFFYFIN